MAEYLNKYTIPASGSFEIPLPGAVLGVYADNPVTLEWKYNDTIGPIVSGSQKWEPTVPFEPMRTSYLRITTTAQTVVSVRVRNE